MKRASDQAVLAIVRLVGTQDTATTVQHPGTDEAAIAVRIGRALLYLHQETTAEHFLNAWTESQEVATTLPVTADRRLIRALRGMPEPGVVVNAIGRPACSIAMIGEDGRGGRPFLRVQLGRVAFEVRDRSALYSCTGAFREAHALARHVFVPPGSERVLRDAVGIAADAFFPGTARADLRRTPTRIRPTAPTQPPPQAAASRAATPQVRAPSGPTR